MEYKKPPTKKEQILVIVIVSLAWIAFIIFLISGTAKAQTGYIIVIDYADGTTKCAKTENIELIKKSYYNHFKQEYNVSKELENHVFFEHRNNKIRFYVEKRKIVVKKNGKVKYRKIKKKSKLK